VGKQGGQFPGPVEQLSAGSGVYSYTTHPLTPAPTHHAENGEHPTATFTLVMCTAAVTGIPMVNCTVRNTKVYELWL